MLYTVYVKKIWLCAKGYFFKEEVLKANLLGIEFVLKVGVLGESVKG